MKKIFTLMGLVASASILLTNCTRNLDIPSTEKGNFQIFAQTSDTRTANDGLSTKWVANDAINVFHAAAGTTTYGTNDKFTIAQEDLATGKFYGALTEGLSAGTNYDWYALYPYNASIKTPSNPDKGYLNIGCNNSAKTAQTQDGNNSTAHLAGQYFPLYAQAKNVASDAPVALTFKPVASVLKVVVKNDTDEDLTVSEISFSAAKEDVIGSYYIDFAGEEPVLTPSGDTYVSKSTTLKVSNGTAIASGKTANFYLAIRPFSTSELDTLTINVNGLEKKITDACTFKAGDIKTVNFSYDKKISSYVLSFPDDNSTKNKCSNYTSDWTAIIGTKEWTVSQFNNNQWGNSWTYIKAGRKTKDSPTTPYIKTNAAFTEAISCVSITYGPCSSLDKVSNAKLIVASDADFTKDVTEYALTITSATEVKCDITPTANRYYKISYNCGVGGANGYIQINKVTYFY